MDRRIFVLAVAALFLYIAWPLLFPVIMGAILAVLVVPGLEKLEDKRFPTRPASAMLTIVISILVLVPIAALIFFGAKSGFQQLQAFRQTPGHPATGDWIDALIETPGFHSTLVWISKYFPASVSSLAGSAHDLVQGVITKLGDWLGQLITALPGLVMALLVTTLSLYFFLADGRKLILFFRRNSPFTAVQTEQLLHTLAGMCRSVILASLVSGLIQSVVMFAAVMILGVPNPALLAAAVFVGSFIPVVGSAPVTLGVVVHQFFVSGTPHGFAMLSAAIVIATVDNFIRPMFLREAASLHPLIAFVAAFGGLQTFGFVGIFLGPIIAGLFIAMTHILKDEPQASAGHTR